VTHPFALLRRQSGFVKDVATLVTGKVAALFVTFFSTPIISRLFEPEDFGVAALFASLVLIMAKGATLSWESAAILAREEEESRGLCRLAVYTLLGSCCLLWLLQGVAAAFGLHIPFSDKLGRWTWVLPFSLLLVGLAQIADGVLTRAKNFLAIAASDLSSSVVNAGSRVANGAAFGSSVWGLIAGLILGDISELAVVARASLAVLARRAVTMTLPLSRLAARYRDFPLYACPNAFIRMLSQELPTIVFAIMFSPAVVGFYAMASRLARLPLKLAAQALQRVLLQRLAHIANAGGRLAPAYTKITLGLAAVALLPFVLLWLTGEWILTWFLGPKWEGAGRFVVILVPWLYALWVSSPATTVLTVMRRQALLLKVQILLALARLAVFVVAYRLAASPEATLQAFVAVSATAAFGSALATYVIVHRRDRSGVVIPQP
jgi:O-antigen/teichoic acid export membrane protein